MTLYEILGVDPAATASEIRKAWKRLCAELHPDRNHEPGAGERLAEINLAYDVLGDPERRAQYDAGGGTAKVDEAAEITGLIVTAIDASIGRLQPGIGPSLLALTRQELANQVAQMNQAMADTGRGLAHLEQLRKRITRKEGENAFHGILDQRCEALMRGRETLTRRLELLRRAAAELETYSEELPEAVRTVRMGGYAGTGGLLGMNLFP